MRSAHRGEIQLDPAVTRPLITELSTGPGTTSPTTRELEVLLVGGQGANKEIAAELVISERTARTHVSNVPQDWRELADAGGGPGRPRRAGGAARGEGAWPTRRWPSSAKTIGEAAASAFSLGTERGFSLAGDDPAPAPRPARRLGRVPRSPRRAAGFGKTTLLAQWRAVDERPFAWFTADLRQRPGRAVDRDRRGDRRVRPDFGDAAEVAPMPATSMSTMRSSRSSSGSSSRSTANWFSSSTTTRPSTTWLPRVACYFMEAKPRNVQLVIASRADPAIPVAKLRAEGRLLELRALDLCFTKEEEASS